MRAFRVCKRYQGTLTNAYNQLQSSLTAWLAELRLEQRSEIEQRSTPRPYMLLIIIIKIAIVILKPRWTERGAMGYWQPCQ